MLHLFVAPTPFEGWGEHAYDGTSQRQLLAVLIVSVGALAEPHTGLFRYLVHGVARDTRLCGALLPPRMARASVHLTADRLPLVNSTPARSKVSDMSVGFTQCPCRDGALL